MSDLANLSTLYSVISEVGALHVVVLLQLSRLRKGKVSPESKDGVILLYRVPQKSLTLQASCQLKFTDSLLAFLDYLKYSKCLHLSGTPAPTVSQRRRNYGLRVLMLLQYGMSSDFCTSLNMGWQGETITCYIGNLV
jgi:hypothetical protein